MSDKKFDPTESIRTLTSTAFDEVAMTLREHQDTDRHYIGDALPVPSAGQVRAIATTLSAGELPFPARVDHLHDLRMPYTYLRSDFKQFMPGESFFNNLLYTGWGNDWRASSQIVAFPTPGIYFIHCNIQAHREAGGNYLNECNTNFYYGNGTVKKIIDRRSNFDLPVDQNYDVSDIAAVGGAPSTYDNVQISLNHNDTSGWQANVQHLFIFRLCSVWPS